MEESEVRYGSLLVTGGAGFIGANFVHYWMTKYPQSRVVVLDALTYAGNRESLACWKDSPNFQFVHGSVCDQGLIERLMLDNKTNIVIHFAAESHVDRSIPNPDAFVETNIIGTYNLLKAAKSVWIDRPVAQGLAPKEHRFHHVSTDEVYGSLAPSEAAFTEASQYKPNSPYSASKAASDHLVRAYHQTYDLHVTTSNCSNCYGPFHHPEKLIPLVMTNILRNKPLPIYGDGQQIRDWLYVDDHVRAIDLILTKGRVGERYNIGGNNEWRNIDLVRFICKKMNLLFLSSPRLSQKYPKAIAAKRGQSEALIVSVIDRVGHDRRYAVNIQKSTRELGYSPQETFETGFQRTLDWYLANENWWLPLLPVGHE